MSPNLSPTPYRDRADYMATYREKNGSGRDHTPVECFCGKTVKMYNFDRHVKGLNHPPAPDFGFAPRAHDREAAEERERLLERAQAQFDGVVSQVNKHMFIDVGESASSSDLVGKGLSLFDNNLCCFDSVHPRWKGWTRDFVIGMDSYYNLGQGMALYQEHVRSMEKDYVYRRKIERARRRLRMSRHGLRTRAVHAPAKNKHIKLPVELRQFLGEVDYSE